MLKLALILLYLKICACSKCDIIVNVTGGFFTENVYMDAYVIRAHSGTGEKMCVRDCLMQSDCNAINFRQKDWSCELLSVSYPGDQLTSAPEYSYSNISQWTMVR